MFKTIGIFAHVDGGKTTFSEQLLYKNGSIRNLGRVDNQTAFLDCDNIEKERKAVEKAISELNDISSGYSELNNIKYNLERIKSKNKSEEDKLQRFETALKNYFANIKDNDTTYKMEQIYKQGVEQFVQFFLNDKFKSSKVEYHEKTKRIKYILFEQI